MDKNRTTLWLVIILISLSPLLKAQTKILEIPSAIAAASQETWADKTADGSAETQPPEDWNTIFLAKSKLPLGAYGGFVINKVEFAGCTRELVRLQWRLGDPIDLYVITPRPVSKSPVILYLFDYDKDSDIFRADGWCEQVEKSGVAAAGFVAELSGQRFHAPRPMKQWIVSELQETLAVTTHDVQMILNYLETRPDLDMKHVGMFGQGSGGSIAILAAAADPRIHAIDVVDPWGDWPQWLKGSRQIPASERAIYLKPEFLDKVAGLDPVKYLPLLRDRAIYIEQISTYPLTPSDAAKTIASAAPRRDEVAHYEDLASWQMASRKRGISGWLGMQIKP